MRCHDFGALGASGANLAHKIQKVAKTEGCRVPHRGAMFDHVDEKVSIEKYVFLGRSFFVVKNEPQGRWSMQRTSLQAIGLFCIAFASKSLHANKNMKNIHTNKRKDIRKETKKQVGKKEGNKRQ